MKEKKIHLQSGKSYIVANIGKDNDNSNENKKNHNRNTEENYDSD